VQGSDECTAYELRAAATSGLMALIGREDGPPLAPPPGLVSGLDALSAKLTRWSAEVGRPAAVDWGELVTIRAKLSGLRRHGQMSANGTCRLLRGSGGWAAFNLARREDVASVAAITDDASTDEPWSALERALEHRAVDELVERAQLLGVPAASLGRGTRRDVRPWSACRMWATAERRLGHLRIVDLSSMWAGPLAASLLSRFGGHVTKVQSASRPDGALSQRAFYRTLHSEDQPHLMLDLGAADGRAQLQRLLAEADVVIESSRPRALEQFGVGPDTFDGPDGKVWLSITGYGRAEPVRNWVAFGDDAAVAGGLVAWEGDGLPVFCGDALADPVTGMLAAAAALEALAEGGGVLLDVPLQACAASLAPSTGPVASAPAERDGEHWQVVVDGERIRVRDLAEEALT